MPLGRTARLARVLLLAPALAAGSARAEVQILNLSDLSVSPSANLPSQLVLHDEVCVRVTGGQGSYRVRIDGQDGQGLALAPVSGGGRLPFSVVWDSLSGDTRERDAPGEIGVFDVSSESCASDAWLAAIEVRIARGDMQAMLAGPYHGGLVIEISVP
jgi:hypothetical protein